MDENTETPKDLTPSKLLTQQDIQCLEAQNKRIVTEHKAKMLEIDACKYWDLFYKRNETRFFKDRHWTTREFKDLLNDHDVNTSRPVILEVGCGVGNFIFPLIEEGRNFFIYACDFSPRAVELVKRNKLYNEQNIKAFQTDITTHSIHSAIDSNSIDIVTLIFVLSAIHPDKFTTALENIYKLLKPGGIVLFRDYGLYDMAQLRFKPGHKIADNFYMRQDGTRSYYFSVELINKLFAQAGYELITSSYVHRRTVNKKENIDVPRIFVQGKFIKPKT